jgi:hypothetical protein
MPRPLDILNSHPRLRIDKKAIVRVIATLDAHADKFRGGCPAGGGSGERAGGWPGCAGPTLLPGVGGP